MGHGVVATETVWPTKPKILTGFYKKSCLMPTIQQQEEMNQKYIYQSGFNRRNRTSEGYMVRGVLQGTGVNHCGPGEADHQDGQAGTANQELKHVCNQNFFLQRSLKFVPNAFQLIESDPLKFSRVISFIKVN